MYLIGFSKDPETNSWAGSGRWIFRSEAGRRSQRQEVDRWTIMEQKGRPGHMAGLTHRPGLVIIEYLEDCPAKA